MQRFSGKHPCPVCGGKPTDPQKQGRRCYGFQSGDYVHCTREEYAGTLSRHQGSDTYAHWLAGPCNCGKDHSGMTQNRPQLQLVRPTSEAHGPSESTAGKDQPRTEYVYTDEHGNPVHRTVRSPNKTFRQERYVGGEWMHGLQGVKPILYNLKRLVSAPGETRYVCEGEKDAERLIQLGLLATTCAGGADAWDPSYTLVLAGAPVVIFADNDQAGERGAAKRAASLYGKVPDLKVVRFPGLSRGGDVSDFLDLHSEEALRQLIAETLKWQPPTMMSAPALMALQLPDINWAIDGVVPEGLLIVGGAPKAGKSFLMISMGAAIARGTAFLGKPVTPGDVLLLLLEDNVRRVQRRFRQCFGDEEAPGRLTIATDWPRLREGGLEQLEGWLKQHPEARLVVIDTLKKVRTPVRGNHGLYDQDYEALEPLQELAQRYAVTIIVVHHLRKQDADDPIDMLSGSTGLAASADGILILQRTRGEMDATLTVVHREGEELELALSFDKDSTSWEIAGDAEYLRLSSEARAVIDQLPVDGSPVHYKDIARNLGIGEKTLRVQLYRMVKRNEIAGVGKGLYSRLPAVSGNSGNIGNIEEPPEWFDTGYMEEAPPPLDPDCGAEVTPWFDADSVEEAPPPSDSTYAEECPPDVERNYEMEAFLLASQR
jgi:hypothetical protein